MIIFISFILISTIITLSVNQIKKLVNVINKIKGMEWLNDTYASIIISFTLAFWAIFSYQSGLLLISGMEWVNLWFKNFDLFVTSVLVSGGSSAIYEFGKIYIEAKKAE